MEKEYLVNCLSKKWTIAVISKDSGLAYTTIRYYLKKYNLKPCGYTRKWSDDDLARALPKHVTLSAVLRELKLTIRPSNYSTIKKKIKELGLDASHITGASSGNFTAKPFDMNVFVDGFTGSRRSVKRLILKEKLIIHICDECNCLPLWKEKRLVLVLDHKNGKNDDYRLENLRFLCPNCNSQQSTFCRKN